MASIFSQATSDLATSLFRGYSVNSQLVQGGAGGLFGRPSKTTIIYDKRYLDPNFKYESQPKVVPSFKRYVESITGERYVDEERDNPSDYGFIEIDAVTSYSYKVSSNANQRTVENLTVYSDGKVNNPDSINISGTIDILNSNKQELFYKLLKENIPIQLYTHAVNPDGLMKTVEYIDEGKLFMVLDLQLEDAGYSNTVNFSMSVSEVVTFQSYTTEKSQAYVDTVVVESDPENSTTKDANANSDLDLGDPKVVDSYYEIPSILKINNLGDI